MPEKLADAGFAFAYPELDAAVRESFEVPVVA
ncbi:DUF1731 domain-containing protein [Herbaspirillum sp. C7C2]